MGDEEEFTGEQWVVVVAFHGESRTVGVAFCEGWQVITDWRTLRAEFKGELQGYPEGVDGKNC